MALGRIGVILLILGLVAGTGSGYLSASLMNQPTLDALNSRLASAMAEISTTTSKITSLESELAAARTSAQGTSKVYSEARMELESLSRQLKELRDSISVPLENVAYVFSPNKITIVDPNTLNTKAIDHGIPEARWGKSVAAEGNLYIFVVEKKNNEVVVINTDKQAIEKRIKVAPDLAGINNPFVGEEIWVRSDAEGTYYVIDIESLEIIAKVTTALTGTGHGDMLWMSDFPGKAYVTNAKDAVIHVVDLEEKRVTKTVPACDGTHGISYSMLSKMAYVSCTSNKVAVIDPATDTLVKTLEGGANVYPGMQEPYLSHTSPFILSPMSDKINVIDVMKNEVVGSIPITSRVGVISMILEEEDEHGAGKHHKESNLVFALDRTRPYINVFNLESFSLVSKIHTSGVEIIDVKEAGHGHGGGHGRSATSEVSVFTAGHLFLMTRGDGFLTIIDMEEQKPLANLFVERGVSAVIFIGMHEEHGH
ncbi:MAG: hypothetical protein FJ358_03965 [Thaumarchaeota archaeon]|nr:hypothetical protein [Nitrososphaerota archaeon]